MVRTDIFFRIHFSHWESMKFVISFSDGPWDSIMRGDPFKALFVDLEDVLELVELDSLLFL